MPQLAHVLLLVPAITYGDEGSWTDRLGLSFSDDCQEQVGMLAIWAWAGSWLTSRLNPTLSLSGPTLASSEELSAGLLRKRAPCPHRRSLAEGSPASQHALFPLFFRSLSLLSPLSLSACLKLPRDFRSRNTVGRRKWLTRQRGRH